MDLSSLTRFRLRRVNPYRGLVVDENTWADAHDYHREHARLHALAFHSEGVIAGLEVRAVDDPSGMVEVGPGLALDSEGNTLVVGQERRVEFEGLGAGLVFVVISYHENRVNSDPSAPRGAPANRIVESYQLEALEKLPDGPHVELARVSWTGPGTAVRDPRDAHNPALDETDQRFRLNAQTARPRTVRIGVVSEEQTGSHLRGITNLIREVDNVAGYRGAFAGFVDLNEGTAGSNLLYLLQPDVRELSVSTLASHLARGGVIMADDCRAKGEDNVKALAAVAGKLDLKLAPVAPGDPLLSVRYPFSSPPGGAADGDVMAGGRFVVSARDYGCAWSGACATRALPRESIRDALEWGVNVAVLSVQPPAS